MKQIFYITKEPTEEGEFIIIPIHKIVGARFIPGVEPELIINLQNSYSHNFSGIDALELLDAMRLFAPFLSPEQEKLRDSRKAQWSFDPGTVEDQIPI